MPPSASASTARWTARRGAHRHDPFVLRRPAARAAGRGARRSAVRGRGRGRGRAALRERLRALVPGGARRARRGRAPRPAPARALADRDGPRPMLRAAAWELLAVARLRRALAARAVRARSRRSTRWSTSSRRSARSPRASAIPTTGCGKALGEDRPPVAEATRRETVRGRDYDALEAELLRLLRGDARALAMERARRAVSRRLPARRSHGATRRAAARALRAFATPPAPTSRRCCATSLWPLVALLRRAEAARRQARLPRPAAARPRPGARRPPRARTSCSAASAASSSTSSRTPIRCRPRSCCCSRPTIRRSRDWLARGPRRASSSSSAIPSSRSTASAAPTSRSTRSVKQRLLSSGAAARHLTVASARARYSARGQRRLRAADGRRNRRRSRPTSPLEPFRAALDGQPALVALPVPAPYSDCGKITNWRIDESLPDAAGAFVDWLVHESGWTVTERERPDQPRADSSRATSASSSGASELRRRRHARLRARARGAPYPARAGRGGSFHEREEVEALRNALGAIEWPDDELAVFATLRGPFFALADGALLVFREDATGTLHPFRTLRRRTLPAAARSEVGDGARRAARPPPRTQPPADRRHDRAPARRDARARGDRDLADGRAGARQRDAADGHGAALRSAAARRSFRAFVDDSKRAPSARRPARRRWSRRAPRACAS